MTYLLPYLHPSYAYSASSYIWVGEGADRNAARPSPAALTGVPRARCYNSTSSIYINSTLMKPDIEELIFCVSVVIHDRVVQVRHHGRRAQAQA